ncbi:hypothetical protein ABZY09_29855 [Streptomyces sp. NPDC002928]|uniref:hypothetical protein n=1 Tax=Streptomyces sp. NPDC002928 TaxID=3154440 RepID=UPI0033BB933A
MDTFSPLNGHVPDFDPRPVSPGEYPVWDEALAVVNRDLAAALPEQGDLRLIALPSWEEGEPENVYVALPDGRWHGNELGNDSAATPLDALITVAEAAQETVIECLWRVWPVCTEHDLGMHPREEDGRPVWWCAGGGRSGGPAHVGAALGELDAL